MPPINKETATTERLLGQMVAEIRALNDKLDRTDDHFRELRSHDKQEIVELRKELETVRADVEIVKQYMLRVEGGKKMLFAMLGIAGAVGGFVWEVLSRLLPHLTK